MLVQKYITNNIIKTFMGALAVLFCVMLIVQWVQMGRFISLEDADLMLLAFVPLGRFIVPMAFLFSILIMLERLSSDSEIIALKASGVKSKSINMPIIWFSVFCMILNLLISTWLGPLSMETIQKRLVKEAPQKIYSFIKERDFDDSFKGISFYVGSVDQKEKRLKQIFIESKGDTPYVITAEKGEVGMGASQVVLKLYNGSLFMQKGKVMRYITFDEYDFVLNFNLTRELGIKTWETASQYELKELITKEPDPKWIKEYYNRYSFPVLSLILGFVGITFGYRKPRASKYGGFIIGISAVIGYYFVFITTDRLVKSEMIEPLLGAWIPNIIFCAIIGIVWVLRSAYQKRPMR
jgi:lipopolysaccharide export system permease protein